MNKIVLLLLLILILSACGARPASTPGGLATQDLAAIVNATLTTMAQSTPQATASPTLQPRPETPTPSPEAETPTISLDMLHNGVYTSPDWGEFQLTDGIYFRDPPTSQESSETYSTRMLDTVLRGDIDLDGSEDAVVFLATQSGGTGHFVEMAAVLNQNGSASNAATRSLGDRVIVEAGTVQDGVITLSMRVQGPNDGMCCPSLSVTWTFRLENGRLIQIS